MPVNLDKPHLWKEDVARSVDQYNQWFLSFAPSTYRATRIKVTKDVEAMLHRTNNLRSITLDELKSHPQILPSLRMSTAPPIARDRLVGLAGIGKSLVYTMEGEGTIPPRMPKEKLDTELAKIASLIMRLADVDIFLWLTSGKGPTTHERDRAVAIIADRLSCAIADEAVNAARKLKQMSDLARYLDSRGYREVVNRCAKHCGMNEPATYTCFGSVPLAMGMNAILPIDAVVQPIKSRAGNLPILLQAVSPSSLGVSKRQMSFHRNTLRDLRMTYGDGIPYALMMSGHVGTDHLGMQAAESLDWVWQHRLTDLGRLGV